MSIMSRLIPLIEPLSSGMTYTIRHGLARGLKRRGGLGFLAPHQPLSAEETFLSRLSLQGLTVYDVGCFEGLYTLFFARQVGQAGTVVCFEPIESSCRRIERNVLINGFQDRIRIQPVAIGSISGMHTFVIPDGARGSASGSTDLQRGAVGAGARGRTVDVPVRSLDSYLGELPPPDFIKIDVEGMELEVIRGARETLRQHRPALFIETHGSSREVATELIREILRELAHHGYSSIHAEKLRRVTADALPLDGSVHLYSAPQERTSLLSVEQQSALLT